MAAKTKTKKRKAKKELRFEQSLVLNQYLLSLFGVESFEDLADGIKADELEGTDENNIYRIHYHLVNRFENKMSLSKDSLLEYDQNIFSHTQKISARRDEPITWKYFQYLSLLFTEIYLDKYFRDSALLLSELNEFVTEFNVEKDDAESVDFYTEKDLNKLAFWSATGSGKTLLMHINIHQFKHYFRINGNPGELNRTILLTPNEGLSLQHLEEFRLSGLSAELFNKDQLSIGKADIEILDVHKLREEAGDKTVAVDSFEGNNLVLVDEGHRGSSGDEWKSRRDALCENGFSFEYSATFGQAMKASNKRGLIQEYAKCIIFDYSYKYFYHDGYGKDYQILNLAEDKDEDVRVLYLTACLLAYYEQLCLYLDNKRAFHKFLLEKPLWVFVGGSVTKGTSAKDLSDTEDIVLFLAGFVKNDQKSIKMIERLMGGKPGLLDEKKREIFGTSFNHIRKKKLAPEEVYSDILKLLFNASFSGGNLYVEELKGSSGEIALKIGDAEPFGVINIGDSSTFCRRCERHSDLVVEERDFSDSLFQQINSDESTINVLIGSRKFSEGWNSWRVSTMGLMNIGKNEGSQIIQLFGRGVRLKGYGFSLKRSSALQLPKSERPAEIEILETLNVFGIRSNYMQQFREYLEDEGLPSDKDEVQITVPVISDLGEKKLKTIKLKEGTNFKKDGEKPTLGTIEDDYKRKVFLDWYPKVQAMKSSRRGGSLAEAQLNRAYFEEKHLSFLDFDEIFFEMQRFKNERSWYNLNISKDRIRELLTKKDWYDLYIPKEEMEFDSFSRVRKWQEIAIALLRKYCEQFYNYKKQEFEAPHLQIVELSDEDENFPDDFEFFIDTSEDSLITTIESIRDEIKAGTFNGIEFRNLKAFRFARHLYYPLVYIGKEQGIRIVPKNLDSPSEKEFLEDLVAFYDKNPAILKDTELYLLRNQSKKGIGFFDAGNFYPDFILWLVKGGKQYVTFVDPKGIRFIDGGLENPKIQFFKTIKEIEQRLKADTQDVVLNSFILSGTAYSDISWAKSISKEALEECNILFQVDDKSRYVQDLIMRL